MENIIDRISLICDNEGITITYLERQIDASKGVLSRALNKKTDIQSKWIARLVENYPLYNPSWLLTGKGAMLKEDQNITQTKKENLIPFYDDVESIGGNHYVAETESVLRPTEYIDAGDWFPDVSEAIRHYNDSMVEYPSGCILALRRIHEVSSIVWGCNYVIETNEIRVTKRIQTADHDDYVMAYSTNTDTYPDGKQIHEPLKISKKDIIRLFLILGRVVKEHSFGPVYAKNGSQNN